MRFTAVFTPCSAEASHQREKCAVKIENLYRILRNEVKAPNSRFVIEEVLDTKRCERENLKAIREATANKLQSAGGSFDDALRNEELCAKIVAEYATWYARDVRRQLGFSKRVHYSCVEHHHEMRLAGSLLVGGAFGAALRSPVAGALVALWWNNAMQRT